jgi:hypothetical protein
MLIGFADLNHHYLLPKVGQVVQSAQPGHLAGLYLEGLRNLRSATSSTAWVLSKEYDIATKACS